MRDYGQWARGDERAVPDMAPATTVFGEGDGLPPGVELAVEIVASASQLIEPVYVDSVWPATEPFPAAVRAGAFVFTSSALPTGPDGEVVRKLEDVQGHTKRIPELEGLGFLGAGDERIAAQTLAVYTNLIRVVEAAGGTAGSMLKQNGYARFHLKQFTHVDSARRALFTRVADVPPATTVEVADLGVEDALLQFEAVAAVSGEGERVGFGASDATTPYGFYTPVMRFSGVAFTAGELAYSPEVGVPGSWEGDDGRALLHQGRFVLKRVRRLFEIAGAEATDVARLNFYVRDRRFAEVLHRLAVDALDGASPAFVDTTVRDCGPYESCLFELDAIAAVREL